MRHGEKWAVHPRCKRGWTGLTLQSMTCTTCFNSHSFKRLIIYLNRINLTYSYCGENNTFRYGTHLTIFHPLI